MNKQAPIPPITPKLVRFFERRILPEPNSGCWLWNGATDNHGYGLLNISGKVRKAHRVSYEMHCAKIPDGKLVLHKCDVRSCVNPAHFFLGSDADNAADRSRKGRNGRSPGAMNGRAKITEAAALEILHAARSGEPHQKIAARFGVSGTQVWRIFHGKAWANVARAAA